MVRFPMGGRFQSLALLIAAVGAVGLSLRALPALATDSPTLPAQDPDADAKTLTKLDDDWSKAAATRDAEQIAAFYADDAIAYPPNEPVAVGKAAARKTWAAYFVDKTFSISWKTTHAEVAKSGDLGYTSGTYEDSFTGPDGKKVKEVGKYLCVWKKQKDGSWKAVHDMWNADAK